MDSSTYPAAIIGAGPYGLTAAAHLRASGVEACVYGKPLEFWQRSMPDGMFLRSSRNATHIADPNNAFTLDVYEKEHRRSISSPIPLTDFIAYGLWFQNQVAPHVDPRRVVKVIPSGGRFHLQLEDGEELRFRNVIIATGIASFAHRPPEFRHLPPSLASHSSDHPDLARFSGKKVLVVGGGQSALETAVLISEAGGEVEVLARIESIRWLRRRERLIASTPRLVGGLLYHKTDVGPPVLNQIIARPDLFRRFPVQWQAPIAYRCIRPAASGWLIPRAGGVKISTGRRVMSAAAAAAPAGDVVTVTLDDQSQRTVDHVVLATGFQIDISRQPFLPPQLLQSVRCKEGYPLLGPGLESSLPGLYFIGAPAALSFGPLMRFIAGTTYTGKALSKSIIGKLK